MISCVLLLSSSWNGLLFFLNLSNQSWSQKACAQIFENIPKLEDIPGILRFCLFLSYFSMNEMRGEPYQEGDAIVERNGASKIAPNVHLWCELQRVTILLDRASIRIIRTSKTHCSLVRRFLSTWKHLLFRTWDKFASPMSRSEQTMSQW